jgi:hypothetical protein
MLSRRITSTLFSREKKPFETITPAYYHIKSSAIYELLDAKGIKSVLLIPTIVSKETQNTSDITTTYLLKRKQSFPKKHFTA